MNGRKHFGKRRKCWLPAFSPFSTMFLKDFLYRIVKSHDSAVKSQTLVIMFSNLSEPNLNQEVINQFFAKWQKFWLWIHLIWRPLIELELSLNVTLNPTSAFTKTYILYTERHTDGQTDSIPLKTFVLRGYEKKYYYRQHISGCLYVWHFCEKISGSTRTQT